MKRYAERDIIALDELGNHYGNHAEAMTAEGLHSKSDIAAELAWRDAEIERLRMQLAACGVVAMANTSETADKQRDMHPDYMSASCQDVMDAVDREMSLRKERDQLNAHVQRIDTLAWKFLTYPKDAQTLEDLNRALGNSPAKSLAAHDAEVIERLLDHLERRATEEGYFTIDPGWLREYADQLRQQAKEVQPVNDSCELECGAYGTYCRCRAEKANEVQS